mmetsp:Transcript_40243/g.110674  ORF Transcript_40243/g.110674 Transcript_40243/m.110674 type:complete len:243 (-) Transcript_40243:331-1059(-)
MLLESEGRDLQLPCTLASRVAHLGLQELEPPLCLEVAVSARGGIQQHAGVQVLNVLAHDVQIGLADALLAGSVQLGLADVLLGGASAERLDVVDAPPQGRAARRTLGTQSRDLGEELGGLGLRVPSVRHVRPGSFADMALQVREALLDRSTMPLKNVTDLSLHLIQALHDRFSSKLQQSLVEHVQCPSVREVLVREVCKSLLQDAMAALQVADVGANVVQGPAEDLELLGVLGTFQNDVLDL